MRTGSPLGMKVESVGGVEGAVVVIFLFRVAR